MNRQERRQRNRTERPEQPVTYRLDAQALHEAYKQEGLVRPELITQKSPRTGDKNYEGKTQPSSKETLMSHEQTDTVSVPQVAKKNESKLTFVNGPSLGARAIERSIDSAIVGTFVVGAGAALMALSKLILAGPSASKPAGK